MAKYPNEKPGMFCDVYGVTLTNLVLEYLLENQSLGIAVGDTAKELGISRPKAYQIINEFEEKGYVVKYRIIGRTQLYKLNKENQCVKLIIHAFDECIKMVMDEYSKKEKTKPMIRVK